MTKTVETIIFNAGQLCTVPAIDGDAQRGRQLGELGIVADGALAIADGVIVAVGGSAEIRAQFDAPNEVDAGGHCVLPGFVDPHSHVPWAGDRAGEFEMRIGGASYMEIMNAGGGIMSTVRQVRDASLDELVAQNLPRLARMLAAGTTSLECKSGYGLTVDAELKQLDAVMRLNQLQPIELTPTFLPAHAVPAEYKGRTEAYIDLVIDEMIPAGVEWMVRNDQPLFFDVFCEEGVFDLRQSQRMLAAAQVAGYRLKIHADEFVGLGGTKMAAEMGAISADHIVQTPDADIEALGRAKTIAISLPATPFGLGHTVFTPAQAMLDAGAALAIATDANPGTAWCESMQTVMSIACRYLGLTPAQAIVASTVNAAFGLGRANEIGSLLPGKQADLLILDGDNYQMLGYRFGSNNVRTVIKKGEVVVENC